MKNTLFIISLLIYFSNAYSQSISVANDGLHSEYLDHEDYDTKHNSREGYWKYFDSSKTLIEEGNYKNNWKQGLWISYFSNGNKFQEIEFIDNKAKGKMQFYYENGKLRETGSWENNHWVGEYYYYYENGIMQYYWVFDSTGTRSGTQMYFHQNGNTMFEGTWISGRENGLITEYYEDGSIKSEKNFNTGKIDTTSISLYKPAEKKPLKLSGNQDIHTADTMKIFSGNGYFVTKNKKGKTDFEGIWKNGKYVEGNKYIYNTTGSLKSIIIYRNGVKIGEKQP